MGFVVEGERGRPACEHGDDAKRRREKRVSGAVFLSFTVEIRFGFVRVFFFLILQTGSGLNP